MKTQLLCLAIACAACLHPGRLGAQEPAVAVDWPVFLARHDLVLDRSALYEGWGHGLFNGNGLVGSLVYRPQKAAGMWVWRIGSTETWDHQEPSGQVPHMHNNPYYKALLSVGAFEIDLGSKDVEGRGVLWDAENILATDALNIRTITLATRPIIVIDYESKTPIASIPASWKPDESKSGRMPKKLNLAPGYQPNPAAISERLGEVTIHRQPLHAGGEYVTAWRDVQISPKRIVRFITIQATHDGGVARKAAGIIDAAAADGIDALVKEHRSWWHAYYPKSFVTVPDARVESYYWINVYKWACLLNEKGPPLAFSGPWNMGGYQWPALWWNEETEYAFGHSSNRMEQAEPMMRWLDRNIGNLQKNTPADCEDGITIGRATGLDYRSNAPDYGILEPGNLGWQIWNYWQFYQRTMDDDMLRQRLFPLMRKSMNYYLYLLKPGADGKLHLPSSHSPELTNVPNANYSLAFIKHTAQSLLWSADRLKINDPKAALWQKVVQDLVPFPSDPQNGLHLGTNSIYKGPYYHVSHLMPVLSHAIHIDQPENRELCRTSVRKFVELKINNVWGVEAISGLLALVGHTEDAVALFPRMMAENQPNTLTHNTSFKNGPFGAAAIHDVLFQSFGGVIRPFPGDLTAWKDAAFHHLRAEGAFLVSGKKSGGKVQFITITSLAGEPCRIKTGMARPLAFQASRPLRRIEKTDAVGDVVVEIDLKKGETATLYTQGTSPDYTIGSVAAQLGKPNFFGLRKDR